MPRTTCASFSSLLVQLFSLNTIAAFNLDTDYSVIKQGPTGSFFGFAVAQHQVTYNGAVEQWYDCSCD